MKKICLSGRRRFLKLGIMSIAAWAFSRLTGGSSTRAGGDRKPPREALFYTRERGT